MQKGAGFWKTSRRLPTEDLGSEAAPKEQSSDPTDCWLHDKGCTTKDAARQRHKPRCTTRTASTVKHSSLDPELGRLLWTTTSSQ
ncbi:hypothetical protein OPT61_g5353 [Boeremia exigua]|uniref:Uncharacterized protein n=1 Tax=Boeremia exigua TaxID=749465 RepID=A0ACC2IAS4_9PLEO|nr:hypothetical protein OPT61_g5353 [Boeremia exigua]